MSASQLPFAKMSAQGNRFLIINKHHLTHPLESTEIVTWSKTHLFDQLLVIEAQGDHYPIEIFNADGSRAEQCGNGMRALVVYVQKHFTPPDPLAITLNPPAGSVHVKKSQYRADGQAPWVAVTLPGPIFCEPLEPPQPSPAIKIIQVTLGNPHLVHLWPHPPTESECLQWGAQYQTDRRWPTGINVGLAFVDQQHIKLRVFERGVGPTLACGSGACAAAIASAQPGDATHDFTITQPGGTHVVNWSGKFLGDDVLSLAGAVCWEDEGVMTRVLHS